MQNRTIFLVILATSIYYIYKNYITINDVMLTIVKGRVGKGSNRNSNCQTQIMAANECWISVEV